MELIAVVERCLTRGDVEEIAFLKRRIRGHSIDGRRDELVGEFRALGNALDPRDIGLCQAWDEALEFIEQLGQPRRWFDRVSYGGGTFADSGGGRRTTGCGFRRHFPSPLSRTKFSLAGLIVRRALPEEETMR
jgi:hypothetical protein